MKHSIHCIVGLQLPKDIELHEIKDIVYSFHHNLLKSSIGRVTCASIHKKSIHENKSILVISVFSQLQPINFDVLLKQLPNIHIYKRYIIADVAIISKLSAEVQQFSFEKFSNEIEKSKAIFVPDQPKPSCILKAIYQHYYCIDGNVIWYNSTPINITKGKYFARQLYCEFYIDSIKTNDGYKVAPDATINVSAENVMPRFSNNQLTLEVEELQCPKHKELLSNHFKIVVN
ncbi:MAG: hypothetical protein N2449_04075 [Bacteroidales bacterium]|nr:hypothetical protein [Bacteroidales bacterium]